MTTFPLSTLAGIIWDSGAASIRLCHVLVELGMTKPNSKCQSSIILPLNRTFCSIRNFSIGSWLEKLISLENVKDSIITISSWNESSQWANSPKPLRFHDYSFFFSWNESFLKIDWKVEKHGVLKVSVSKPKGTKLFHYISPNHFTKKFCSHSQVSKKEKKTFSWAYLQKTHCWIQVLKKHF